MPKQIYEDYWDLTLAWTDFNGKKFLNALKTVVDFIDLNKPVYYTKEYYRRLQLRLVGSLGLNETSIRKGINEFVKLGFINTQLLSYPSLTKDYLQAESDEERQLIFSQIVYSNSSFRRSVTEDSSVREINFVIKSIQEMGELPISLLPAMININISEYPQGYITKQELEMKSQTEEVQSFAERKYNQADYLKNLLKKLDGVIYNNKTKSFVLGQESEQIDIHKSRGTQGRDSYLQRLYKGKLQQESLQSCGQVKCMVEQLAYPSMIASHIKPYKDCNEIEAYDSNNGLLLSKNVDSLFDKYYISFDDEGKIIFYNRVPHDIKEAWKDYKVVPIYMNEARKKYLKIHRELCETCN